MSMSWKFLSQESFELKSESEVASRDDETSLNSLWNRRLFTGILESIVKFVVV